MLGVVMQQTASSMWQRLLKYRVLPFSVFICLCYLLYVFYESHHLGNVSFPEGFTDGPCRLPHLELWPSDLPKNPASGFPGCKRNGFQFTVEKARDSVLQDELLPSRAWLERGRLMFLPDKGTSQCDVFPIYRLDEYRSVYGDPIVGVESGRRISVSHFMLLCQPKSNVFSSGNFSWNTDLFLTQQRFYFCGNKRTDVRPKANNSKFNVLLLGIDSLSRLSWQRYLPRTMTVINEFVAKRRASVFNMYHVVGDGTTSNLLALLTGHLEEELPESRRFSSKIHTDGQGLLNSPFSNEKEYQGESVTPLDNFPWIWKEYEEKGGYATHYIEDTPNWGTFQYRLRGFGSKKQPVHSYGRPCVVAAAQDETRYGKQLGCIGSRPTHEVLLESLQEFFYVNRRVPRFSLTFLSEMIHEEPEKAIHVDDSIAKLLRQIDRDDENMSGDFANTLVVLFSDHGARMGKARLSFQGKLEERLPMLGIIFPRKLAQSWRNATAATQANADRLCSPFDLHATLQHLLTPHSPPRRSRGQSLFTALSRDRGCSAAGVASYWCACTRWVTLRPGITGAWHAEVTAGAHLILDAINAATGLLVARGDGRKVTNVVGVCERLRLEKVISAEMSTVSQDVLRFKGTADRDGRTPDFMESAGNATPLSALRMHLLVEPGSAHFETLLYTGSDGVTFRTPELADIHRLDEFERHAGCLQPRRWGHARQLCICKQMLTDKN